ncbi:ATP-dependent DNA helicase Q1-like, partial [Argopecten irradians]|uniref:ATP-dependent DNA helicase Q1-like n=1 Tax=Argopecten irradians TaxID=31199 RepID=UPI003716EDC1
ENIVIVVDEAHCILQWQDDFRPAYKNIKNLKAIFPKFTMVAMTATVNSKSVKQIRKDLQMKGTLINCTPLLRKNISLAVKPRPGYKKDETQTAPYDYIFKQLYEEYLLSVENKHDYPVTIVYTKLIWCSRAIDLAKILLGDHMYIGDPTQDAEVNQYILETLGRDDNHIRVIFATIALGMGADLKKVKRVIHAGAPSSAEEYIQEIGRAGRTGGEAESVIYVNAMDLSSQIVSAEMKNYLKQTEVCRRKFLSDYLNCPLEPAEYKCCDLCSKDSDTEVKGQNQVVRFLVKQALKQYVEADVSGEITFHLNDMLIERITETYEMVPLDSVENYYKLPTFVAESVKVILGTFK